MAVLVRLRLPSMVDFAEDSNNESCCIRAGHWARISTLDEDEGLRKKIARLIHLLAKHI